MLGHRVWGLPLLVSALLGQQYPFVTVANSPRNIEHIIHDQQGRLWVSTHDDIFCFDGTRFYSLRDLGFPPIISLGLADDLEGGILSSTELGVFRFREGRLERIVSGPKIREIIAVAPGLLLGAGPESQIAMTIPNSTAGANRLYRIRIEHARWVAEPLSDWKSSGTFSRDAGGNILSPCPGGWCEFPARLIANWKPGNAGKPVFHASNLTDVGKVVRDRYGCLWFRTMESAACQCPAEGGPVRLPAAVAGRNVWSEESESEDGSMLFASVGSLAMGRPGQFQMVNPDRGLPPVAVSSALRSRDGTIWVGSIDGLYRFSYPFRMELWKGRHGSVWSFARSGQRLFAGTSAGVAYLNPDRQWVILPGSSGFGSISSLLPDKSGNVYAVVSREAVILLSAEGRLIARTPGDSGRGSEVLARTSDGDVWVGGSGIHRVRRQGSQLLLDRDPLPEAATSTDAFALDAQSGRLWACSAGGLIHRIGREWRRTAANLPKMPCAAMAVEPGGDLWLAYPSLRTLAVVHAAERPMVRMFPANSAGGPFFLGLDTRGWLWRGGGDGVYAGRLDQARNGAWLKLNETDGLTNIDANRRSFFSDSDGSVWWAADNSIVHFSPPPDLVNPRDSLNPFLSSISIEGGIPTFAQGLTRTPYGKHLAMHIGSLQFAERNALHIRYRLLPEQKEWRTSEAMDIDLGVPAWGTHSVELQSRVSTGAWSSTANQSFLVLRPWWISWPGILGFCGVIAGGTAGAVAWRRKQHSPPSAGLPDLVDWRLAALSPELQWVGTILDRRYEVVSLIAMGGFAAVLKGRDLACGGRPCAIKIFRHELVDKTWVTHRFQQEVMALEQIRHSSVVSIYGHGFTPDGAPFLVMEFIKGDTLRNLLSGGTVPLETAGSFLEQASKALGEIHALEIYHRDLKPENLMIRSGAAPGTELVLIDFSIAIVREPDQTIHGLSRAAGTIYYMAPEQAVGFASAASDVYSLAKILLEMLTGERLSTLLPNAAMDLPDRVKELVRDLPIPFSQESVGQISAALQFDPLRRPQDARAFAEPIVRDLMQASRNP